MEGPGSRMAAGTRDLTYTGLGLVYTDYTIRRAMVNRGIPG